jgi:hypothetical protein
VQGLHEGTGDTVELAALGWEGEMTACRLTAVECTALRIHTVTAVWLPVSLYDFINGALVPVFKLSRRFTITALAINLGRQS